MGTVCDLHLHHQLKQDHHVRGVQVQDPKRDLKPCTVGFQPLLRKLRPALGLGTCLPSIHQFL